MLCACDAVIVALSKFENTILQIFVDHIYGLTKPVTTRKKTLVHKMALKILQGNDRCGCGLFHQLGLVCVCVHRLDIHIYILSSKTQNNIVNRKNKPCKSWWIIVNLYKYFIHRFTYKSEYHSEVLFGKNHLQMKDKHLLKLLLTTHNKAPWMSLCFTTAYNIIMYLLFRKTSMFKSQTTENIKCIKVEKKIT